MKVEVMKISGDEKIPAYATAKSAGFDLVANSFKKVSNIDASPDATTDLVDVDQEEQGSIIVLRPGERILIGTGIKVAIPAGFEMDIRPRSGLALNNGITVLNGPGTIDADYRNEIGVILINMGVKPYPIHIGDRIAQGVLLAVERVRWDIVESLNETERKGGFGHTGM